MEQEIQLNEHNKQEYPPMHTTDFYIYQIQKSNIKIFTKTFLSKLLPYLGKTLT